MNVLVIATHPGAFLTIAQLKLFLKPNNLNVVVAIPQSQIDKYATFEEDLFKNYVKHVKKACGKRIKPYIAEWDMSTKLESSYKFLKELGATGEWLVLEAGALLGHSFHKAEFQKTATFGVVYNRVHPKLSRLYTMLGQPEESRTIWLGAFYVNMDVPGQRVQIIDSDTFHRPDLLYKMSFGPTWCIRYHQIRKDCVAMNFWMEAIRGKQEKGELIAYPYDSYLAWAEKIGSDRLPKQSYDNIVKNGLFSEWMEDLVQLDL